MKLALGTAQFGLDYGIANKNGRVGEGEARAILARARDAGFVTLDTAIAYGESERVLGALGVHGFKIVTKLPAVPDNCSDVGRWAEQQVRGSLDRLEAGQLYAVLLHRPAQLLEGVGKDLYLALQEMKSAGLTQKVGISVYDVVELEAVLSRYTIEMVQAPLNILDRNLIVSGWAERLKRAGVETHVRSPFLQGLLLMPPEQRPEQFHSWAYIWQTWDEWLSRTALSPLQACLRYLSTLEDVDRIIVGVDSLRQLNEVIDAAQGELPDLPPFGLLHDPRLLNPSTWNQL